VPIWLGREIYCPEREFVASRKKQILFQADGIRTPTLFMGGEKDFNVPIIGGEQMYQALRSLGVETQLVIYPAQFHGLTIPIYQRDRLERYLAWYDKHLKEGK
jgi:dipeptidyl aminopeptidase/acylaminoacyl peptidase